MIFALSALFAVLPLALATIVIDPIQNATSAGPLTISWTSLPTDPQVFSIELLNQAFNNAFGIANNVDTSAGSIDVTLGVVPVGPGYTISFVDIGNINSIFATSPTFSVGATVSTSASSTSSTSSSSSATGSTTPGTTVSVPPQSTSSFGVTVSNTSPGATNSNTGTGTGTGSSSPSPSAFNGAGSAFGLSQNSLAAYGVMLLGVIAGGFIGY